MGVSVVDRGVGRAPSTDVHPALPVAENNAFCSGAMRKACLERVGFCRWIEVDSQRDARRRILFVSNLLM